MTRISIIATAVFVAAASPAVAQDLLGGYYALLGYEDMRNSRGARLADFCAVVQQDRANVHRFGIRHDGDQGDPWFGSLEARQRISVDCRIGAGSEYIPSRVLSGEIRYVHVQVFGWGGVPQFVVVHEGAG